VLRRRLIDHPFHEAPRELESLVEVQPDPQIKRFLITS